MKTFNESMIKNYKELNNCGTFEIEGYTIKFNNHSKTLETEYPFAKELRAWWFDLEEEPKAEDKRVELIKEHGFEEVTEVAIAELEKKTTKTAKSVLDKMNEFNHRVFKKDGLVIVFGQCYKTAQELKWLEKIYNCEVKDASKYFDEIGMCRTWTQLTSEMWAMGSAF